MFCFRLFADGAQHLIQHGYHAAAAQLSNHNHSPSNQSQPHQQQRASPANMAPLQPSNEQPHHQHHHHHHHALSTSQQQSHNSITSLSAVAPPPPYHRGVLINGPPSPRPTPSPPLAAGAHGCDAAAPGLYPTGVVDIYGSGSAADMRPSYNG